MRSGVSLPFFSHIFFIMQTGWMDKAFKSVVLSIYCRLPSQNTLRIGWSCWIYTYLYLTDTEVLGGGSDNFENRSHCRFFFFLLERHVFWNRYLGTNNCWIMRDSNLFNMQEDRYYRYFHRYYQLAVHDVVLVLVSPLGLILCESVISKTIQVLECKF